MHPAPEFFLEPPPPHLGHPAHTVRLGVQISTPPPPPPVDNTMMEGTVVCTFASTEAAVL